MCHQTLAQVQEEPFEVPNEEMSFQLCKFYLNGWLLFKYMSL